MLVQHAFFNHIDPAGQHHSAMEFGPLVPLIEGIHAGHSSHATRHVVRHCDIWVTGIVVGHSAFNRVLNSALDRLINQHHQLLSQLGDDCASEEDDSGCNESDLDKVMQDLKLWIINT